MEKFHLEDFFTGKGFKFPSYCVSDYVGRCPNDNTFLPNGTITLLGGQSMKKYTEYTRCSKCGCHIARKPSQKRMDDFEKKLKNTIITKKVG